MKIPVVGGLSVQRWSRWLQRAIACTALVASASAWAQNAVSTFAGTLNTSAPFSNTGAGTFNFTNPSGAVVDSGGNVFIADAGNHVIRKITPAGVVSTFAGAAGTAGYQEGTGTGAQFRNPAGITIDTSNVLYVADTGNHAIRMIATDGTVTTLAGGTGGNQDGTGTGAKFNSPQGVAAGGGNVYVADTQNNTIRQIVVSTKVVTTIAGSATGANGTSNGSGTSAAFFHPEGIISDTGGTTLYLADTFNNLIRKITVSAGVGSVTTLAGSGNPAYAEGTTTGASFSGPSKVAFGTGGNILVGDTGNHVIRSVTSAGVTSLFAGVPNSSGSSDGLSTAAKFSGPTGVASTGTLTYVVDTSNKLVRKISAATAPVFGTQPNNATIAVNGTATFTAAATGNPPPSYQWQRSTNSGVSWTDLTNGTGGVSGATTGTLTITGVTLAQNGDTFRLQATNGFGSAAQSQPATLSVTQVPVITSDNKATFVTGKANSFTITATGSPPPTISVTNLPSFAAYDSNTKAITTQATLDNSAVGTYTLTVNATNTAGSATPQTFTLTVTNESAPTISAQPQNFTVTAGNTAAFFTVTASGVPAISSYQWLREPGGSTPGFTAVTNGVPAGAVYTTSNGGATLNIAGITPSMNGDKFRVLVGNTVGTVPSSIATLTVSGTLPTVATSPQSVSKFVGETTTFSGSFTGGSPAPSIQWQRQPAGSGSFSDIPEGAPYTGTQTGTLTVAGVTNAMSGDQFRLKATNIYGDVFTSAATLTTTATTPTITADPVSLTRDLGQSAVFSATVTGNPTPTLRWWRFRATTGWQELAEGAPYSGTQTNTLTISSVSEDMNGDQYRLRATNDSGQVESAAATLTLNNVKPNFTTVPQSVSVNVGSTNVTFTATATGSPTYRWQRLQNGALGYIDLNDDGTYFGTTSTTLTLGTVTVAMNGDRFRLVATNAFGSSTSTEAVLTVIAAAPGFATQPINKTANIGETAQFTVVVSGSPTPSLRWQRQQSGTSGFLDLIDDATYSGTTSATLTITNVNIVMSGDQFRVVATNDSGSNPSVAATLIVNIGTTFSTFAGQAGIPGSNNGTGTGAQFNSPTGIAVATDGTIYIADTANHVIRKVTTGGVVTTLAGRVGLSGSLDGASTDARFNSPQGIAVDAVGNVYVADTFNHTIRLVSSTGTVSTIAGTANTSGGLDGVGAAARFFLPSGLAVDSSNNIYVADSSNHAIRKITFGGNVFTLAGSIGASGFVNNIGTAARFNLPTGVAVDSTGNVYVADSLNHAIRKIAPGGSVSTLAGNGTVGILDGNGVLATFNRPSGLAVDTAGNVFVADTFSSTIRKITTTGDVTTLAGFAGFPGTADGSGQTARFNNPYGIAVDISNNIYVLDTRNHTIRRSGSAFAPSILTQPISKTAAEGDTVVFTITAQGTPTPSYQWQRATADLPDFFNNLSNDGQYSGVNTNQLTISGVSSSLNNSRYRVVVSNGVLPAATSDIATLTIGSPPVFTSGNSARFRAGQAGSFNVTTNSSNTVVYSLASNPSWLSIDPNSGVISGTPPDTSGSPFTISVIANNGVIGTQLVTITVDPAVFPPTITSQPNGGTINQGDTATFNVGVDGTAPFTYQWRRDGIAISGATNASLVLTNVQPSLAGTYSVVVTNSINSVTSNGATLTINSPAVITIQPHAQIATVGSTVVLTVAATGNNLSYQWRKNGANIPGANSSTLTLSNVTSADVGNYDVTVTNALGSSASSLAQVTLANGPVAPTITAQPTARTVLVGRSTTFSIGAAGSPTPSYQWRRNGVNIPGANSATYTISSVQTADAGLFDVVITSTAGTVTSGGAELRVITRSYAGIYFGSFGGINGNFALYVREDNTGVFIGYLPGSTAPVMGLSITVNDNGSFSFAQATIQGASAAIAGEPARAAALSALTVGGQINSEGAISGAMSGGANGSLSGTRASDTGGTQNVAGYYQAGSSTNGVATYTIAGPNGQAFVLAQSGTTYDGGLGTTTTGGNVTISTGRTVINETIASSGTITGNASGAISATLSGGSDLAISRQRLLNISSRSRAAGDATAIAGFVISGQESKPVLIRAVGPTLGSFGVSGALTTPRLQLYRGSALLETNTGIGTNRAAIDAAGVQAGAFALAAAGTDAAILTTLPAGAYTAVVDSSTAAAGIALVEVYDLSAASPGQKLLNISTRATAGTADATLTAGFVVPPGAAKRVLVRAIGPGLTPFGVAGVLAQPILTLLNGSTVVASNTNYATSADQAAIVTISAQVGGFALSNNDSALLVTLPPGNYTAQVLGPNNTTGVALIEVYEVP